MLENRDGLIELSLIQEEQAEVEVAVRPFRSQANASRELSTGRLQLFKLAERRTEQVAKLRRPGFLVQDLENAGASLVLLQLVVRQCEVHAGVVPTRLCFPCLAQRIERLAVQHVAEEQLANLQQDAGGGTLLRLGDQKLRRQVLTAAAKLGTRQGHSSRRVRHAVASGGFKVRQCPLRQAQPQEAASRSVP